MSFDTGSIKLSGSVQSDPVVESSTSNKRKRKLDGNDSQFDLPQINVEKLLAKYAAITKQSSDKKIKSKGTAPAKSNPTKSNAKTTSQANLQSLANKDGPKTSSTSARIPIESDKKQTLTGQGNSSTPKRNRNKQAQPRAADSIVPSPGSDMEPPIKKAKKQKSKTNQNVKPRSEGLATNILPSIVPPPIVDSEVASDDMKVPLSNKVGKTKKTKSTSSKVQSAIASTSNSTSSLTSMQQKMKDKLGGARFRWINEQLVRLFIVNNGEP